MLLEFFLVIFLFLIPPFLIYFRFINYKSRFYLLTLICLIAIFIMVIQNWSLEKIGLRFDNFLAYAPTYILFILVSSLILILVSEIFLKRPKKIHWWTDKHLVWGFIPISLIQELLYRGFLLQLLSSIFISLFWVVIINNILFMILHIFYEHRVQDLLFVFLEGVLLTVLYLIYPNIILLGIAHAIHNFIAYYYNFFSKSK